jgi:glycosyltransferase involved in cell wall biosynthesis
MLLIDLKHRIADTTIADWCDIEDFLDELVTDSSASTCNAVAFRESLDKGIGFITYDFGIDGVSIEIFKYADCLEKVLAGKNKKTVPMHFVGGEFYEKADVVLKPEWNRFQIDGMDGWNKWYDGKYFSKLYYEDMPEGSDISREMAIEMWKQAGEFAEQLGEYMERNAINLLIPVNIPTNPGNFAIMLAIIMVTEAFGSSVISSNHDFYWEGGKPPTERDPDGDPGVRDHFFHNCDNKPFFSLFKRMYPWNGKHWLQVNINTPQSEALIERFGFSADKVFELGTSISDSFFKQATPEYVKSVRQRMAYVVSDGKAIIEPVEITEHLAGLSDWMENQRPVACAHSAGLKLDLTKDKTLFCLQPTRVVGRKRIEMDLQMLQALMHYEPFKKIFFDDEYQLVVHITGPIPVEHQEDLATVLKAYIDLCESVPPAVADRIFIEFSVGNDNHPCFEKLGLETLMIEDIYQLATVILFPSETEGRGLPIIEASAGGIPIVCSRYFPEEVFDEVVGTDLPNKEQIEFLEFPDEGYSKLFLASVNELILHPEHFDERMKHNRRAVSLRYGTEMIQHKFEEFLNKLEAMAKVSTADF